VLSPGITTGAGAARLHRRRTVTSPALAHRLGRWASPSLLETVRLQPRSRPETKSGTAQLRESLEHFRRTLRRAWLLTVVRRSLLFGLPVAIVVALAAHWQQWPGWLGPVAGVLVAAAVVTSTRRQAPDTAAVARFLDHELSLKEQLATALELDSSARISPSMLVAETQRRADSTASKAAGAWSARAASATREWVALALMLCALVAAVAIPLGGNRTASRTNAPGAGGTNGLGAAPVVPTIPARLKPISVQVTVVSKQNGSPIRSVAHVKTPQAQAHTIAGHRIAPKQPSTARTGGSAGSQNGSKSATNKVNGKVSAGNGQHSMPFMGHSERFLPTSPASKGKNGAPIVPGQAKPGAAGSGARTGTGSASSRAAAGSGKSGAQGKPGAQQAGRQSNGAGGKPGAGNGQPTQCLYGCAHITANQLSKPGLITGKGQFTGKGIPGGQSAGHAQGAASKLGSAKSTTPAASKHQLNITSGYGPTNSRGRAAKQVTGHNGAGSNQQSVVAAGASGGQSIDYVPPDANVVLPGDNTIVGRYFTSHSSS
jgi:hypothetical protein